MAEKRSVGVRLRLWVDQYGREAQQAVKSNQAIAASAKSAKKDLDGLATGLIVAGTAMTAAFAGAVFVTAKFDKQMSEVGAVAGATADELDSLRQAALDAGRATSFSASEAAKAEAELAKAGVVTADILGGALTGSLALAAAGTLDLETAATIAANAMNIFGLKGRDMGHIADVLAAAANKSATDVEQLGIGLGQVGLVAAQVGFTLEETVGLLAAAADRGLKGSDGATSFKTALLRLAAPLGEAQALMEKYGISLYDANGQMVDAVTIAGQLQAGLGDLSAAERNAALSTIFGQDAIRAANVLYELGAAGVKEYIDAVNDQGAATDVAAMKLDNLAGDLTLLKSKLEGLFITGGSGVTEGLRDLAQGFGYVLDGVASLPDPVLETGTALLGLVGVGALAVGGFVKMRSAAGRAAERLAGMGAAGAIAARGLQTATSAAGKAGAVFLGLSVIGAIGRQFQSDLNPQLEAGADSLLKWTEGSKLAGEGARLFGETAGKLTRDLDTLLNTGGFEDRFQRGFEKSTNFLFNIFGAKGPIDEATETVSAFDASMAHLVQSGHVQEATDLLVRLSTRTGIPIETMLTALPQYAGAMQIATEETRQNAYATADARLHTELMTEDLHRAAGEVNGLRQAFDMLNGTMIGWMSAEIEAEAAVDDLEAALRASAGSLDVNTEAGRAAKRAVLELAQAAADAAQAKYDETASVEEANAVYQGYIDRLKETLRAAGLAEEEIDELVEAIAKFPEYKSLTIDLQVRNDQLLKGMGGSGALGPALVGPVFREKGGIDYAGTGMIRQAMVTHRPILWGEPSTGGEAYIPFRGERSRSMAILSEAARHYDAAVVPNGAMWGGGSQAVEVRVSLAPGADGPLSRAIEDRLRFEVVNMGGGSVQTRYGTRGRLG